MLAFRDKNKSAPKRLLESVLIKKGECHKELIQKKEHPGGGHDQLRRTWPMMSTKIAEKAYFYIKKTIIKKFAENLLIFTPLRTFLWLGPRNAYISRYRAFKLTATQFLLLDSMKNGVKESKKHHLCHPKNAGMFLMHFEVISKNVV